jgi:protein MpaA
VSPRPRRSPAAPEPPTRRRCLAGLLLASVLVAPHAPAVLAERAAAPEVVGRSVLGRPIVARIAGDRAAPVRVLVVGCIHGDERAGTAITRGLRSATPAANTAIWIVDEVNPDGCRAHTRYNARGVDLNRNARWNWRLLSRPGGGLPFSGPRPLSEPESRAIRRLVRRLHPAVTIWYHQRARLVDDSGGDRRVGRRYADLVGLPFRPFGIGLPGRITGWQNASYPSTTAFVVELAAGELSRRQIRRHVEAVLDAAAHASP